MMMTQDSAQFENANGEPIEGSVHFVAISPDDNNASITDSERVPAVAVYHEHQSRQMCLKHTLNSLLQEHKFSKRRLDDICRTLTARSWPNPHRSIFGIGNYDVNVLMHALTNETNKRVVWFDARLTFNDIVHEKVYGYIFNKASDGIWGAITRGRHWFVVKCFFRCQYYNMDSKLTEPERLHNFEEFFTQQLAKGAQCLLVVEEGDEETVIKRCQ